MDANGHRFWMLADRADYDLTAGECQIADGCLQLSGRVDLSDKAGTRKMAIDASNLPPVCVGHFDDWAFYDPTQEYQAEAGAIVAGGVDGETLPIHAIPEGAKIHDLAVDDQGVLRIAGEFAPDQKGVFISDMRKRWSDAIEVDLGGEPDRVAGKWVLERKTGRVWHETGDALADLAQRSYADHIFRPNPEYTNQVRHREYPSIDLKTGDKILDCAARLDGMLAVLVISSTAKRNSRIVFIPVKGVRTSLEVPFKGFASSIGFVTDAKIVLTYINSKRAIVLDVDGDFPIGLSINPDLYPLRVNENNRICRGSATPASATHFVNGRPAVPKPINALSMPSYRSTGSVAAIEPAHSDSKETVWHRLVVEGDFPIGTGAIIGVVVGNSQSELDSAVVHEHYIGDISTPINAPRHAWMSTPSELPFHRGMISKSPVKDRTGSFSALIQNTTSVSRELVGQYAQISVTLASKGQSTPSIAAVRIYGSRFSLVKNYLPNVFKPAPDPALRTTQGDAHPLDFYDRFTANFESILTRLEDKVVAAPSLTNPMAAPPEALDWLAGWIGLTLQSGMSERQRREMLANGMRLHRRRGTLNGMRLALDIASEGQVGEGGIVAIEDFRLRRVFATILGADLGVSYDPLLAGPVDSGNSFVGPTLHLGDAADTEGDEPRLSAGQQAEFAALYRAPTDKDAADAVRDFFEQLAWRVTILVHHEIDETRMALLRAVAQQMAPAHIKLRIERSSKSLILGLYSLLGVDTYLKPRAGASPIILDKTVLGEKDLIKSLPTMDPRIDYGETP
jgi:phage tail-like protein